jgi:hypothetical protein
VVSGLDVSALQHQFFNCHLEAEPFRPGTGSMRPCC